MLDHGGSWRAGHPFQPDVERVAQQISQDGFWVFLPTYRLAPCKRIPGQPAHASPTATPTGNPTPTPNPSGRPPEQTDDVMFAIKAIRADTSRCNGKIGIVAVSSGGSISSYVGLYRGTINTTGRPQWNISGDTDRPDCVVTFSSPFDLSDQDPFDIDNGYSQYIDGVHNYIGTCNRDVARLASPISLVTGDIKDHFKPLFMVQGKDDNVCPGRQLDDMEAALISAGIGPCQYKRKYITETSFSDTHGLGLWGATDPDDPTHKIGETVLVFLHNNLD